MALELLLIDLPMLGLLGAASLFDLRHRRIPNLLTFPAAVFGLMLHTIVHGQAGFVGGVQGWLVGVGLLLVPFAMRWIGAGDVKLFAALGALRGPNFILATIVYAAIAGGVFSLYFLLRRQQLLAAGRFLLLFWNRPAPSVHDTPAGRCHTPRQSQSVRSAHG